MSKPKKPDAPPFKPAARRRTAPPSPSRWRWAGKLFLWAFGLLILLSFLAQFVAPPSTLMLARWFSGQPVTRLAMPLAEMGPFAPRAAIIAEDAKFCRHAGVDWDALHRVIEQGGMDGPSRGASTIPMQTAKNLFLWPGRSYLRKGMEIPLALWIDLFWSKRRMLEIYLNMAEWGDGIFGLEAAAQQYFHVSAKALSRQQAALLVAALPNPLERNPTRPGPYHRQRAAAIAAQLPGAAGVDGCLREDE